MASAQIVDSAANSTQDKSIRKEVLERINSKIIASDKLLSALLKKRIRIAKSERHLSTVRFVLVRFGKFSKNGTIVIE